MRPIVRYAYTSVAAAMIVGGGTALARGADGAATSAAPDARAARIMSAVERGQRNGARFLSMDVRQSSGSFSTWRRILGVTEQRAGVTRILYAVTSPLYFRGTALLIHDPQSPKQPDRIWADLPGLAAGAEMDAASLGMQIPGIGLTFEQARGWIATDAYAFRVVRESADHAAIEARPASDRLARDRLLSRIAIEVDVRRSVVTRFDVYDLSGNATQSYVVTEFTAVKGTWLPARAVTQRVADRTRSDIVYRYAALRSAPPAELMRVPQGERGWMARLLAFRDQAGLAAAFPDSAASPW